MKHLKLRSPGCRDAPGTALLTYNTRSPLPLEQAVLPNIHRDVVHRPSGERQGHRDTYGAWQLAVRRQRPQLRQSQGCPLLQALHQRRTCLKKHEQNKEPQLSRPPGTKLRSSSSEMEPLTTAGRSSLHSRQGPLPSGGAGTLGRSRFATSPASYLWRCRRLLGLGDGSLDDELVLAALQPAGPRLRSPSGRAQASSLWVCC